MRCIINSTTNSADSSSGKQNDALDKGGAQVSVGLWLLRRCGSLRVMVQSVADPSVLAARDAVRNATSDTHERGKLPVRDRTQALERLTARCLAV